MKVFLAINGEDNYTGFCDKEANKIFIGDRLEFYDYSGAIWRGNVEYDDGIVTVSILNLEQVKNPDNWIVKHDWIKSRNCGCKIGYPEYGTWNHNRKQLIDIAGMFKSYDEYKYIEDKYVEKHGGYAHDSLFRPLPCLKILTKKTLKTK